MTLSIITVNKNNVEGLKRTLESVVNQTFDNYEHIIIDSTSTDGSVDFLKNFPNQNLIWLSENDSSIFDGMNKGIKKSTMDYCLFLNSGDYLKDNTVLSRINNLQPAEDLVYTDIVYKSNEKTFPTYYPSTITFDYLSDAYLPHPGMLIKRTLFDVVGLYSLESKWISDWSFTIDAIFKYNCTYRHIPVLLTVFDVTGTSQSIENFEEMQKQRTQYLIDNYSNLYRAKCNIDKYSLITKKWSKKRTFRLLMSIVDYIYSLLSTFKFKLRRFISHQ